ncbi:DUF916 and DUF3324 domain-containing protein [Lactococcus formosensis]|uniref:DUF916 and DUF3324 domain-containing protein n=2 Tax=Lactococcus TaxID=1357 RepID=UPI001BCDBCA3|nr:DUF916 and DUF3324 domain-containing protein [Lactococcus formosensis]MCO7181203.1 DUF916 and DUF3324 domain-containing protein [Lactococcus formosensis]MDG6113449.1 DUF916 and DUF3324 domain-containing protein [Lactococcus formosensis]MDG6115697.1 DUF916 and DUF3324 domain-containing protein [Lactococcus formosensis]MDG6121685.1 DUF916 and DUF3324 domain-containing protein [Lactococcus formosensis]MDG6123245.1 DUF916 and DUF3324 domain-containing protein [Lactococcus formosensis]
MKKKTSFLFFLGLILLFSGFKTVSAAEMKFSVQAVIPENQVDKSQSYFDLRMKAGEAQDLLVDMRNDTSEDVTVEVTPNTAITNQNGIVEYNDTKTERDSSLKTGFKDIATTEKEVTVPAKSTKQLKVHVQMPKEEYSGTILGGIYFSEKDKDTSKETEDEASQGSQIVNKYAYVIGVQLTENDTPVQAELRLNAVQAQQINYRNVITANIQNYEAAILKDLKIEGKVYEKGGSEVLYSEVKEDLRMAPNSNFDFAISLDNKPFKAGKYTFKGVGKSGDKEWTFEKDFEIKGEESRKYNKEAVSLEKNYTWIYILVGVIILAILLVIIVILLKKLKKNKEEQENED